MTRASRARIVMVTAGNRAQAGAIARALVGEHLAACVNIIGPVRSIYRWRSAVHDDQEFLMLIKTAAANLARLERRVKELHSYEVPEVIALLPDAASHEYLAWLIAESKPVRAKARRK